MKQPTTPPPTLPAPQRHGRPSALPVFVVTLFLLLGRQGLQAHSFEEFTYIVNTDNSITITGFDCNPYQPTQGLSVIFPEMIAGLPVTSIEFSALACGLYERITIPRTVTRIPSSATRFIPGVYGSSIFGEGLRWISVDALNSSFTSVDGVLFDKSKNTIVQFPLGRVGSYAIPMGVTRIGDGAFADSQLIGITIPAGVTSIGDHAFRHCDTLPAVKLPTWLTSIGDFAFKDCQNLRSILIPSEVTRIGDHAFENCSITDLKIPSKVAHIGVGAFYACRGLRSISVEANNPSYVSENGVLFAKSKTTLGVPRLRSPYRRNDPCRSQTPR